MTLRNVLVVEDDDNSSELLTTVVEAEGYAVAVARTLAEARQLLVVHRPDIVILDLGLPDGSGLELFEDDALRGSTEVILITGNASVETSIQALRLGAADYLVKPVSLKLLRSAMARLDAAASESGATGSASDAPAAGDAGDSDAAGDSGVATDAVTLPGTQIAGRATPAKAETARKGGRGADEDNGDRFGRMWGRSQAMQAVFGQIRRVARTSISVFIVGESGTGKELVAESIHRLSHRRNGSFEAVNCGAISAQLIESELFGHEKGSFTGAIKQHRGFFERASGGTLFLDEVTEMSLELQVKLLRVLETGTFSRVGSDRLLNSDVRVVAATNRQPLDAVREGKLREDLYYRLNVFQIALPPLRDRLDDLPLIARHLLAGFTEAESRKLQFSGPALQALQGWGWPGNVRELRNYIQRIAVMADGETIDVDDLMPFDARAPIASLTDKGASLAPTGARLAPGAASSDATVAVAGDSRVIDSRVIDSPATVTAMAPAAGEVDAASRSGSPAVAAVADGAGERPVIVVQVGMTIADAERALILETLRHCDGAKERTADMLGISLKTLYNRLRAYSDE